MRSTRLLRTSAVNSRIGGEKKPMLQTNKVQVPWKWIPPPTKVQVKEDEDEEKNNDLPKQATLIPSLTPHTAFDIPIRHGQHFTADEVENGLVANGASDICRTSSPAFGNAVVMLCTAKSPNHMRTLARLIVSALKARGLRTYNPSMPIEGEDDDRWMIVDCSNIVVHFFTKESRKEIDLESHFKTVRKLAAGEISFEDVLLDGASSDNEKVEEEDSVSETTTEIVHNEEKDVTATSEER